MHKRIFLGLIPAFILSAAQADEAINGEGSLAIGAVTAHLNLIDDLDLPGVSAIYNFTPRGQRVGFMGAATIATGSDDIEQNLGPSVDLDGTYLSLLVGPSYRLATHLRTYGMLGAAYGEAEKGSDLSSHEITVAYGLGFQVTNLGRFLLDFHLEGVGAGGGDRHLDGVLYSAGLGYQF